MRTSRPPRGGGSGLATGHSANRRALPALLNATHLFGLALGSALGTLRESRLTVQAMFAKAEEQALLLRMMREAAEILGHRWDKVPDRHRPHYTPEQRFRILRIKTLLGLSQRETAELFRVSKETVGRWDEEALGGATPAEIYFGRTPAHLSAIPPPRGRPGEGPMGSPFQIEYLDAERLLPVLVRKAA